MGPAVTITDSGKLRISPTTPRTLIQAEATQAANIYHNNPTLRNTHLHYEPIARSSINAPARGRVTYTQKTPREWLGYRPPRGAREGRGRPPSNPNKAAAVQTATRSRTNKPTYMPPSGPTRLRALWGDPPPEDGVHLSRAEAGAEAKAEGVQPCRVGQPRSQSLSPSQSRARVSTR